jgi:hypothetical protein
MLPPGLARTPPGSSGGALCELPVESRIGDQSDAIIYTTRGHPIAIFIDCPLAGHRRRHQALDRLPNAPAWTSENKSGGGRSKATQMIRHSGQERRRVRGAFPVVSWSSDRLLSSDSRDWRRPRRRHMQDVAAVQLHVNRYADLRAPADDLKKSLVRHRTSGRLRHRSRLGWRTRRPGWDTILDNNIDGVWATPCRSTARAAGAFQQDRHDHR